MSQIRGHLFAVSRIALGLALAAFLVALTLRSAKGNLLADLRAADLALLLLAVCLYGVVILITVIRWDYLLRVQGVFLRFWDLARLTMTGVFFNLAIPGAVSGDFVKMAYISRQVPDKKAECILTIVVDRIVGILGLFFVASVLLVLNLPFLLNLPPEQRLLQMAAFTVGLGSVGGIAAVLLIEYRARLLRHPWLARLADCGGRWLPARITAVIQRLTTALELYRQRRRAVLGAFLLSVGVHSCIALTLFAIGRSLSEKAMSLREYFLATQVANAVASIPVTPAGVGSRDFVIKAFMNAMEATAGKSATVPVTLTLIILFWGLIGALFFVFTPRRAAAAAAAGTPAA